VSGPASISQQPNLPGALRQHRQRLRALEQPSPGQWVYVLPISPATPPPDLVPSDPLAPTFKNGCTNVVGSQAVSFRIHPSTRVAMRGAVDLHSHALPVVVFTLPAGFRPALAHPVVFPSTDGASIYTGRVDPNGDVSILAQLS
jgi:hypothetical protein